MQEITELKHCPFCGGEAEIYNSHDECYVHCKECYGKTKKYSNLHYDCEYILKAIQAWNNREITPDVIDKISQELQDAGFEEASKWLDCKYEI